ATTQQIGDISNVNDPKKVVESTKYFDGLGREIQSVDRQGSPLGKDVVNFETYDDYGRNVTSFLPFVSGDIDGSAKTDVFAKQQLFYRDLYSYADESAAKAAKLVEQSEFRRVLAEGSAGAAWQLNGGHVKRKEYSTNNRNEILWFDYDSLSGMIL